MNKPSDGAVTHADQISPAFCILPWIHLSSRPNGHMRLCCAANASSAGAQNDRKYGGEVGILKNEDGRPANFNHTDLKTAWNSSYMKTVRKQMLRGEVPPSCTKCFKEEKAGYQSKRNWENRLWISRLDTRRLLQQTGKDGFSPAKIYYIDLRLGSKCNLKCVMCSPHDSSLWVSDWKKLHSQIKNPILKDTLQWKNQGRTDGASYNWCKNNQNFWSQLLEQIPHIRQIYFAGGESTIIPEHYELLERCVRSGHAKQIELRYNSNGVKMPEKLFQLWREFQSVIFHFSLDSIHKMNDYIRYPSRFEQLEISLKRLEKTPESVKVTLSCAVQVLNMYYIPDFIKWKLEQNFKKINSYPKSAGLIDTHLVYHPAHLNVKVLPARFKQKVKDKFENFYPWLLKRFENNKDFARHPYGIKRLKGLVQFMCSEDWSCRLPEFEEYILTLDKLRGTNFQETFPEMADLAKRPTVAN